jgi:SAM-dependent methyltransferase
MEAARSTNRVKKLAIRIAESAMNHLSFEYVGWDRVSYTEPDLDLVQKQISERGFRIQRWDITPLLNRFREFIKLPEYAGPYRQYGGKDECSFLEKTLEHFLSFEITRPRRGQVFMDVGSCVSVVPQILRQHHACYCYTQDLELPVGVNGWEVGSNAAEIPLPDSTLDGMTLHCTFEHFEGNADSAFIRECARLLKPGGKTVILPLYVNSNWTNVTGETDKVKRNSIGFDSSATYWCVIPEWRNRFGRHYSAQALLDRVLDVAIACGLRVEMLRVVSFDKVHQDLWLKWVLVLEKPEWEPGQANKQS